MSVMRVLASLAWAVTSAAALAFAVGCTPPFTIPSSTEISVPGEGILGGNPLVPDQVFPSELVNDALVNSINQSFDTQGYDKGSVKSLTLTNLTLTVTNPEEAGGRQLKDLTFLEKLTLFIAAAGSEETIKVAESDDGAFTAELQTYSVPTTGAELAEALKSSDALDMTADVDPGETPRFETDVLIETELTVVLGI